MAKKRKAEPIPRLYVREGDSLKTIYRKAQEAFTAADLPKYTEIEEGIPARLIVEELEAADRASEAKRKKKNKNGR